MGYKIRDDAPRALSLPVPVGGGDFSPTTNERIYEPGQPIEVITTDIVERFEAGDSHLVLFIEEIVEVDTQEVAPQPAIGDAHPDTVPNIPAPDSVVPSEEQVAVADPEPVVAETPADEAVVAETTAETGEEPQGDAEQAGEDTSAPDNPFASA